jgi:hypothetical protein
MSESRDQNPSRQQKIRELLAQEIQDGENLAAEARKMVAYLLVENKGYEAGDIRKSSAFEVTLDGAVAWSSLDFIVSLGGKIGMIIKCAAGSLDSRQRQAVAAARVIASPPVPIAVVADPAGAQVLDGVSGKLIGEGFGAIPARAQLQEIIAGSGAQPLAPSRMEKEKRILLALDAIQCCVPKGADGGVRIGEPGGSQAEKT